MRLLYLFYRINSIDTPPAFCLPKCSIVYFHVLFSLPNSTHQDFLNQHSIITKWLFCLFQSDFNVAVFILIKNFYICLGIMQLEFVPFCNYYRTFCIREYRQQRSKVVFIFKEQVRYYPLFWKAFCLKFAKSGGYIMCLEFRASWFR